MASFIVAGGYRINWGGGRFAGDDLPFYLRGDPDEPQFTVPPEPTNQLPSVAAECSTEGAVGLVVDAATRLMAMINNMDACLAGVGDADRIYLSTGSFVQMSTFRRRWREANFVVTDKPFGRNRGGATIGALSVMKHDTVLGYDRWPGGLGFIVLHEIAHMTDAGRQMNEDCWFAHRSKGGSVGNFDSRSIDFRLNEVFANAMAHNALDVAGFAPRLTAKINMAVDAAMWFPPYGFDPALV